METVIIRIDKLTNNFHASIADVRRPMIVSGDTEAEAIGKLILAYPNLFPIKIDRH